MIKLGARCICVWESRGTDTRQVILWQIFWYVFGKIFNTLQNGLQNFFSSVLITFFR